MAHNSMERDMLEFYMKGPKDSHIHVCPMCHMLFKFQGSFMALACAVSMPTKERRKKKLQYFPEYKSHLPDFSIYK